MRKNKKRQNQGKEAERICKVLLYSSSRAQLGTTRKKKKKKKKKKRSGKDRWCSQVCARKSTALVVTLKGRQRELSFWPEWHFAIRPKYLRVRAGSGLNGRTSAVG